MGSGTYSASKALEGPHPPAGGHGCEHPGVLDVRGVGATLADLTLARGGPTLATLVRPRSEDLFVRCPQSPHFSNFDAMSGVV